MSSYSKSDPKTIQAMFASIAHAYDKTNGVLSLQLHRYWNRALVRALGEKRSSHAILDLCCGTGEIGLQFLKRADRPQQLIALDFCDAMLAHAKSKLEHTPFIHPHTISYIQADAQEIPLADMSVDTISLAYGLRNVQSPQRCIKETFRVLQPGGMLGILELTEPSHPFLRWGHKAYLRYILPVIGKMCTSNAHAYRYLCNSIGSFICPDAVGILLKNAGYTSVSIVPLAGGIATLICGVRGFACEGLCPSHSPPKGLRPLETRLMRVMEKLGIQHKFNCERN